VISKKLLELAEGAKRQANAGYPYSNAIAGAIHAASANAYRVAAGMAEEQERLAADVVTELRGWATAYYDEGMLTSGNAFHQAADLVAEKLGVK
jgi:hypothetical protein